MTTTRTAIWLATAAVVGGLCGPARAADDVTVFAAASTTTALTELAAADLADPIVPVFGASSTLARQIAQGAPADLFISADPAWMDDLAARGLLAPDTRVNLLGNALVLIASRITSQTPLALVPAADLAARLGDGRLAVGDPTHVPAGRYARQALAHLGLWDAVANRLAPAADVRAALALVARGEAPLGIVYATDAASDDRVTVLGTFPADSHAPIVYPAAVLADAPHPAAARRVLAALRAPAAAAVFRRLGFVVLP